MKCTKNDNKKERYKTKTSTAKGIRHTRNVSQLDDRGRTELASSPIVGLLGYANSEGKIFVKHDLLFLPNQIKKAKYSAFFINRPKTAYYLQTLSWTVHVDWSQFYLYMNCGSVHLIFSSKKTQYILV